MSRTMSISSTLPLKTLSCALIDSNVAKNLIRTCWGKKYSRGNICSKDIEQKTDSPKLLTHLNISPKWQQPKSWKLKPKLRKKEIESPHRFQETRKNSISGNSSSKTSNWKNKSSERVWRTKNWNNKWRKTMNPSVQRYIHKLSTTNWLSSWYSWGSYAWSACSKRPSFQQVRVCKSSNQVKNLSSFQGWMRNCYPNKPYQRWHNFWKTNKSDASYFSISRERWGKFVGLGRMRETVWLRGSWQVWWWSWIKLGPILNSDFIIVYWFYFDFSILTLIIYSIQKNLIMLSFVDHCMINN